ncbi:N-acetylmuramoyl-L-alanine amidase [Paenibacillus darwinianus]|uniref:N-acetylmuramoyl-L-alanine amidase n=1 Tax=Paenibacillus darwinianus TaxID=1380763 RepID=A0A9W5S3W3_9BACL|nr:N-acetylmuramoyl-L-alanine amidase [Paenibacillus darwinianus]EXX85125.1 N-acetylmuramoyl-L-alanine amidase [Paenibacillus darwinianus]EXX91913.1 N-acetylmuramoyl-L-alanine amidase [Paenibacillus darwinianus]EXX92646.1 N-acetylmuramoyl-L-alanine amidase [Paenibacillus darwinianus]
MKKFFTLMLLMSFALMLLPGVGQAAPIVPKLYFNGKAVQSEAQPRIVNQFTLVPLRLVAEQLGYDVKWDMKTKQVAINNSDTEILLTVNDSRALVNGSNTKLDAPALADKGTTYVPLRFVGENLGLDVYWDKPTRSVHLFGNMPTGTPAGSDGSPVVPPASGPAAPVDSMPVTNPNEPVSDAAPPVAEPAEPPVESELPGDVLAIVKGFSFDGLGRVTVDYDGQLTPNSPFWSGTKLVIDIPNAALSAELSAELKAQGRSQGEMIVETLALQKVRYSYYSDKPSTVRIVLDLAMTTEYALSDLDGRYNIDVIMSDGAAATPVPGVPAVPVGNGVYKVVIDAGHGGKDPGAPSVTGHWEKQFNLSIALKVQKLLEQEQRIKPYLTRSSDVFIELDDRAKFANNLNADLFVSIHANRYTSNATGTETYYTRPDSKAFAAIMHKNLVKSTGLPDRKVRQASFLVIRKTTMPAVLLEAGYLSNSGDAKALFTESVQNKIAAGIVAGIKEQLGIS